jgi:hydroxymethylpyrimidine pyrophosphatase-like HAD family hydrolase
MASPGRLIHVIFLGVNIMQYLALATDYDGTLAHDGHVSKTTLAAMQRLRDSGRKILLVTGRELAELQHTFPRLDLCDIVVAENGALLYWPSDNREHVLGKPVPAEFLTEIQSRGVTPFSCGRCIFATWRPHEDAVLNVIQQLGLEYHIIFNKGAVMVLPSGINKATGLTEALRQLNLASDNVVGIGDAENDHSFLESCGVAVAVQNALPTLKQHCDLVMAADHGLGVEELIELLLVDDLQSQELRRPRREIVIPTLRS